MANISDVAKRVGVSAMTVSRVVNGTGYVKAETRQRILQAMKELNYVPNGLARSLIQQKTYTLGLVIPDITNPFFTSMARGAEDVARKSQYRFILCNSDEDLDKEREYLEMLLSIRVDGLLIAPAGDPSKKNITRLTQHKIPLVLLDRQIPEVEADFVGGDNIYGTRKLLEHLIELGHRNIAIVTGSMTSSSSRERLRAYQDVLKEHSIAFDPNMVHEGTFARSTRDKVVGALLESSNPPTAIFAANNFVAVGLVHSLRKRNIRVPQDMAIVCFDDVDPLSLAEPFLTVAMQPSYDEGAIATQLLLDNISKRSDEALHLPRKVILQPSVVIRRSSNPDIPVTTD